MTVAWALLRLQDQQPEHYVQDIDPEKVRMGREMVYNGRAKMPDGGYSKYISNIYVCTDCHNQVKEDPDPANPNPEDRLVYAEANDLPFLQATTFWGMVNRETWYNGDYYQKYGALVDKARTSLYEATQLCSQECSSGRVLEEWEADAINHYYWSLQIKMSDLDLTQEERAKIELAVLIPGQSVTSGEEEMKEAIALIKSKIMLASPADFVEPPNDRKKGFGLKGNADKGKMIYDRSCKTCHRYGGPSLFTLDDSKKTFRLLKRNIPKGNHYALYDIVRHGTYAEPGHRQYMPLYTADRMSDQQLEDLRAYIELKAE